MGRVILRVWLPDTPGVLGQVASAIGRVHGNVTALEVLERDGGVAVDELVVELADPEGIAEMCAELQLIAGVGIEEVRQLREGAEDRPRAVLRAATSLVEDAGADGVLHNLVDLAAELLEAEWVALVDLTTEGVHASRGDAPPAAWLVAFAGGAHFGEVGGATSGSGVLAGALRRSAMALCVGRSVAFRERERHEVEMLARIVDACVEPNRPS
jgi:hypothetical protein